MNLKIKITVLLFFLAGLAFFSFAPDNFPRPAGIKNMLFYLQRTMNKNTIIYELNLKEDGELNENEPIKIYWINYAGKGDRESLNYIQRKYAYGLEISESDKSKRSFNFNFVSYKKQQLYLMKSPSDKAYHVFGYFSHKLLQVSSIYVHIEGGAFWTPKVRYIEIEGRDIFKNEDCTEKIWL